MKNLQNKAQKAGFMRPAGTFSDINCQTPGQLFVCV